MLPIRSRDRLAMKLEAGVAAYRSKADKQTSDGFHWFKFLERIRAGTADDDFLRAVTLEYGEPISRVAPLSSSPPDAPTGVRFGRGSRSSAGWL